MGGSQGARSINLAAIEAFAERPGRDFQVIHLAGRRDYEELERAPGQRLARQALLHAARLRAGPRRGARRLRPGPGPRRRLDLRDNGRRPPGDPRSLSLRHRWSPERQRRLDGGGRRGAEESKTRSSSAERLAGRRSGGLLERRSARLSGDGGGHPASLARPDAARSDRRRGIGGGARCERTAPGAQRNGSLGLAQEAALHRDRRRRDERAWRWSAPAWARP